MEVEKDPPLPAEQDLVHSNPLPKEQDLAHSDPLPAEQDIVESGINLRELSGNESFLPINFIDVAVLYS